MKCPKCQKELLWNDDHVDLDDRYVESYYTCTDCTLEVTINNKVN
jgi:hypothetical protein